MLGFNFHIYFRHPLPPIGIWLFSNWLCFSFGFQVISNLRAGTLYVLNLYLFFTLEKVVAVPFSKCILMRVIDCSHSRIPRSTWMHSHLHKREYLATCTVLVHLMVFIFHYLRQPWMYYPKTGQTLMKLRCNWILNHSSLEGGPGNICVAPTMVV